MKYVGIIPARYSSSRFPGKSIALLNGLPVVVRVYQRAKLFPDWYELTVATDDDRVMKVCHDYKIPCLLTKIEHQDCIDRASEVSEIIQADRYIIIQGDEPFFDANILNTDLSPEIVGFYTCIHENAENPHSVKVVLDLQGRALYFSRSLIPSSFEKTRRGTGDMDIYKQIGLYSFSGGMLQTFAQLEMSSLEKREGVGLLRLLENGYDIYMRYTDYSGLEIDVPEDLIKAEHICRECCQ